LLIGASSIALTLSFGAGLWYLNNSDSQKPNKH
jgi:hypothetical protein